MLIRIRTLTYKMFRDKQYFRHFNKIVLIQLNQEKLILKMSFTFKQMKYTFKTI